MRPGLRHGFRAGTATSSSPRSRSVISRDTCRPGTPMQLHFADSAAAFFVATQQPAGSADEGGWCHEFPYAHRSALRPPWLSAMAQGQAASLLLRVYLETGREELADSALLAMRPFDRRVEQGGVTSVIGTNPVRRGVSDDSGLACAERRSVRPLGRSRRRRDAAGRIGAPQLHDDFLERARECVAAVRPRDVVALRPVS